MKIDTFDRKILRNLVDNCKISNAALAKEIGLTPPATMERVRKLQKRGFILDYKAVLDKKKLGKGLTCFIALIVEHHSKNKTENLIENHLNELSEIEEIHLVTGRYDYLLKAALRDVDDLKEFIFEKLVKLEFINKVETFLSISSVFNPNANLINDDD